MRSRALFKLQKGRRLQLRINGVSSTHGARYAITCENHWLNGLG